MRKHLRLKNKLLYSVIALFALGVVASGLVTNSSPTAQVAAAAVAKLGVCEKAYRICLTQNKTDSAACSDEWKKCINAKCLRIESKYELQNCSSDPDCLSSCTQFATSKTGLVSCCFGGPQHNNSCSKRIDTKCVPPDAEFPYLILPGMGGYGEGERIPNENEISKQRALESELLARKPPLPSFLLNNPLTTWSDEQGTVAPSAPNQNLDWYRQTPDIEQIEKILTQRYQLPPEYQPTSADSVRLNEALSNTHSLGVNPPDQQQTPSSRNSFTPISVQNTFSNQNNTQTVSTANTCHVRLLSWCIW